METTKFELTPFYDIIDLVVPLQKLNVVEDSSTDSKGRCVCNQMVEFYLRSDQSWLMCDIKRQKANNVNIRSIIRFCKADEVYKVNHGIFMKDTFPLHLNLDLNGTVITLPNLLPNDRFGKDGRRFPRPVDVTDGLIVKPGEGNRLMINWVQELSKKEEYFFAVYLVRLKSTEELTGSLLRSNVSTVETTLKLVYDKCKTANDEVDNDVTLLKKNISISLSCPVSRARMTVPIRGKCCNHLQCFDAMTYLVMNFKKSTWLCPVCDRPALFSCLEVDGLIFNIIQDERSKSVENVQFNIIGHWRPERNEPGQTNDDAPFYGITEYFKGGPQISVANPPPPQVTPTEPRIVCKAEKDIVASPSPSTQPSLPSPIILPSSHLKPTTDVNPQLAMHQKSVNCTSNESSIVCKAEKTIENIAEVSSASVTTHHNRGSSNIPSPLHSVNVNPHLTMHQQINRTIPTSSSSSSYPVSMNNNIPKTTYQAAPVVPNPSLDHNTNHQTPQYVPPPQYYGGTQLFTNVTQPMLLITDVKSIARVNKENPGTDVLSDEDVEQILQITADKIKSAQKRPTMVSSAPSEVCPSKQMKLVDSPIPQIPRPQSATLHDQYQRQQQQQIQSNKPLCNCTFGRICPFHNNSSYPALPYFNGYNPMTSSVQYSVPSSVPAACSAATMLPNYNSSIIQNSVATNNNNNNPSNVDQTRKDNFYCNTSVQSSMQQGPPMNYPGQSGYVVHPGYPATVHHPANNSPGLPSPSNVAKGYPMMPYYGPGYAQTMTPLSYDPRMTRFPMQQQQQIQKASSSTPMSQSPVQQITCRNTSTEISVTRGAAQQPSLPKSQFFNYPGHMAVAGPPQYCPTGQYTPTFSSIINGTHNLLNSSPDMIPQRRASLHQINHKHRTLEQNIARHNSLMKSLQPTTDLNQSFAQNCVLKNTNQPQNNSTTEMICGQASYNGQVPPHSFYQQQQQQHQQQQQQQQQQQPQPMTMHPVQSNIGSFVSSNFSDQMTQDQWLYMMNDYQMSVYNPENMNSKVPMDYLVSCMAPTVDSRHTIPCLPDIFNA